MGEPLPEGVTRQEFADLQKAVRDYGSALEELRKAQTEPERREAREEVREEKADLDATARELGISPESLRKAAEATRRQERKEALRPLLLELLDEELGEEGEEDLDEEDPKPSAKKNGADPEPETPKVEDKPPVREHWSDRPLKDLF